MLLTQEFRNRWRSTRRARGTRRPLTHRARPTVLAWRSRVLVATQTAYCDSSRRNLAIRRLPRFPIRRATLPGSPFASIVTLSCKTERCLIFDFVARSLNCCSAYPRKLIEIQEKERDAVGRAMSGSSSAPSDDLWLECDDEVIRILRVHELEELLSRKPRAPNVTPYLLFYVQVISGSIVFSSQT